MAEINFAHPTTAHFILNFSDQFPFPFEVERNQLLIKAPWLVTLHHAIM